MLFLSFLPGRVYRSDRKVLPYPVSRLQRPTVYAQEGSTISWNAPNQYVERLLMYRFYHSRCSSVNWLLSRLDAVTNNVEWNEMASWHYNSSVWRNNDFLLYLKHGWKRMWRVHSVFCDNDGYNLFKGREDAERIAIGPDWTWTIICSMRNISFINRSKFDVPMRFGTASCLTTSNWRRTCKSPKWVNSRFVPHTKTWLVDADQQRILVADLVFSQARSKMFFG